MKHIAIILLTLSLGACTLNRPVHKEPFVVDFDSPKISLGSIEAYVDRFFAMGGLKNTEIAVDYYPREDAVCLFYKVDLINYYLFWDREGRQAFTKGFEQYKEDFAQRKLKAKGSRQTKRAYGAVQGFLIWMTHRFSIKAEGNPEVEIGYFIRSVQGKKASFYTVNQRETSYEDPVSRDNNRKSPDIMLHFTRSQADELVEIFNPQFLRTLSGGEKNTSNVIDLLDDIDAGGIDVDIDAEESSD
jgi:hypothetical protein